MSNTFPNELKPNELKPGDSFTNHLFLCTCVTEGEKPKPKLKMMLNDRHQVRPAIKWNASEDEIEQIYAASFICATGYVKRNGAPEGEIIVEAFDVADTPGDITPFLPPFPPDHVSHVKEFRALLRSVQEPILAALLQAIFKKEGVWKQFTLAAAAQGHHHAYRGGLIEHTLEVARLCDDACQRLPFLRRDFLLTGALLHDIGKLDEMDHGLAFGKFTVAGTCVGHTNDGAYRVRRAAEQIPSFSEELQLALANLILSHHGLAEWGAAQRPATAEAFVLHACDNMSAKTNECHRLTQSARPGQTNAKFAPGHYIFTGDLGLQAPLEAPAAPEPARTFQTAPQRRAEPLPSFATVRLPVRGLAAAGTPEQSADLDEDAHTATLPVGTADFLVRVTGDSMVDVGIDEGDLLLIKSAKTADDGDLVLAHLGTRGEVVKRLRYAGTARWLDSENRAQNYPPLPTDADTLIQGRVVGTLKGQ